MGERRYELEKMMRENRYNHTTLSKAIGIDRSTLSHIIAGRDTSVMIALNIAKVLGTTVEKIFN
jgi:DNA-binding XRE family transcriptional regulator